MRDGCGSAGQGTRRGRPVERIESGPPLGGEAGRELMLQNGRELSRAARARLYGLPFGQRELERQRFQGRHLPSRQQRLRFPLSVRLSCPVRSAQTHRQRVGPQGRAGSCGIASLA